MYPSMNVAIYTKDSNYQALFYISVAPFTDLFLCAPCSGASATFS